MKELRNESSGAADENSAGRISTLLREKMTRRRAMRVGVYTLYAMLPIVVTLAPNAQAQGTGGS